MRRTGRHCSPSPVHTAASRAARAAPAVAVAGALAAVPLSREAGRWPQTAGDLTPIRLAAPAPSGPDAAARPGGTLPERGARRRPGSGAAAAGATVSSVIAGRLARAAGIEQAERSEAAAQAARARAAAAARSAAAARAARAARAAAERRHRADAPHASAPGQQAGAAGPAAHGSLTCSGTSGPLPENYAAIVSFLTAHGYTGLAAAGIAGNIYQESGGNPESVGSGGGGLIGWTPLPAGFVTGNPAADLQTQLAAILRYNRQYPQDIPVLNAASTATRAADVYMTDFERPGIPAAASREAAANAVARACGL